MLDNLNITLGVSGGIAAYKACDIVSRLKKLGAEVDVVMTKNATKLIQPLTFESLSGRPVSVDTFAKKKNFDIKHISLAKKSDLFLIAPATANVIAKLAQGIADDMLSTTALAMTCPIVIAPAMNSAMYLNEVVQKNIQILKDRGFIFVDPESGRLACGDTGIGKLADPKIIVDKVVEILRPKNDYVGKKVLVTCGATREPIDGVRYITNKSSGKMGIEIAKSIMDRGGEVVLVKGLTTCAIPSYITNIVSVETTKQMLKAVMDNYSSCDVIIKAAAPSDYALEETFDNKIKGDKLVLNLVKNPDIAKEVGRVKENRKLVIFCAETTNLIENAKKKLESKNADMVVANDVTQEGAGFDVDTNIVTIISKSKEKAYPKMLKKDVANVILDEINLL